MWDTLSRQLDRRNDKLRGYGLEFGEATPKTNECKANGFCQDIVSIRDVRGQGGGQHERPPIDVAAYFHEFADVEHGIFT
jgi:hypothetical protein